MMQNETTQQQARALYYGEGRMTQSINLRVQRKEPKATEMYTTSQWGEVTKNLHPGRARQTMESGDVHSIYVFFKIFFILV